MQRAIRQPNARASRTRAPAGLPSRAISGQSPGTKRQYTNIPKKEQHGYQPWQLRVCVFTHG
jgi:hypothetical protein